MKSKKEPFHRALDAWAKECRRMNIPEEVIDAVGGAWDDSRDLPGNQWTIALALLAEQVIRHGKLKTGDRVENWQVPTFRMMVVIATARFLQDREPGPARPPSLAAAPSAN